MPTRGRTALAVCIAALLILAPSGIAADQPPPPPNDSRDNAQPLGPLPAMAVGTTVGATLVQPPSTSNEDSDSCNGDIGSVWYRFVAPTNATRLIVSMHSRQNSFDADLTVYRQRRSRFDRVDCDTTDDGGDADVGFTPNAGKTYYVRISTLVGAKPGPFAVRVSPPHIPPASPPGRHLPRGGVSNSVQRVVNPSDAWSLNLRDGQPYAIDVASKDCLKVAIYAPGTADFSSQEPVLQRDCGGYIVFTPGAGEGGVYSILVTFNDQIRAASHYRLVVAAAGSDDLAPGIYAHNYQVVHASLTPYQADGLDLYRFDIRRYSDVLLDLEDTPTSMIDLQLLTQRGRTLQCDCDVAGPQSIRMRLRAGHYYVAVRARQGGPADYTLQRISRRITTTTIAIRRHRHATIRPGRTAVFTARISPAVDGPVTFYEDTFDPLAGWRFVRHFHGNARHGLAVLRFHPPTFGTYRMRVHFDGTRTASPSSSDFAFLDVQGGFGP